MKKIYRNQFGLFIVLSLMMFATLSSCKKQDNEKPPVITKIRAIAAAPNDSTLTKVGSGQNIVIQGSNLKSVTAYISAGSLQRSTQPWLATIILW